MRLTKLKTLRANFKKYRAVLVILVLVITVVIFIRFFTTHPMYFTALKHVRPVALAEIFGLNALLLIALVLAYNFTLELCGIRLPLKENILLTAYSSIVNFFGPLQSGPGVRAVYLKTTHRVRFRDYTLASLIQYAAFAMISALFLIGGSRPWWQALGALVVVGVVCYGVIRLFMGRSRGKTDSPTLQISMRALGGLVLATFAMVVIVTLYYYIELKAVSPHVSLHQAITYTGAANFSLFVSLTPDAIGFRESFLVLSQHLHHIPTAAILAANVIDRGVYAVFLIFLFLGVISVHGRDRLKTWQARPPASTTSVQ